MGNGRRHPQGRQLRLAAARRHGGEVAGRDGADPAGRHDSDQISDTVERGAVKPTYPVLQYPHRPGGGDAIANGFIYRGSQVPALRGKLVFGDITTGRVWYAERTDVLAADDGDPATVAPIHEVDTGLRALVTDAYRARGGKGAELPGAARYRAVDAWTCGSRWTTPASSTC